MATPLPRRTILVILREGTRAFMTIEVCDTEEELAESHARVKIGFEVEVFELAERRPS
jgi:hypothetical protein